MGSEAPSQVVVKTADSSISICKGNRTLKPLPKFHFPVTLLKGPSLGSPNPGLSHLKTDTEIKALGPSVC